MKRQLVVCNSIEHVRLYPEDIVCIEAAGNSSTFYLVGGEKRLVLLQLGQLESMMGEQLGGEAKIFFRIGRSLIINRNFISYINLPKQQLVLSDGHSSSHSLTASKEALKQLK